MDYIVFLHLDFKLRASHGTRRIRADNPEVKSTASFDRVIRTTIVDDVTCDLKSCCSTITRQKLYKIIRITCLHFNIAL